MHYICLSGKHNSLEVCCFLYNKLLIATDLKKKRVSRSADKEEIKQEEIKQVTRQLCESEERYRNKLECRKRLSSDRSFVLLQHTSAHLEVTDLLH